VTYRPLPVRPSRPQRGVARLRLGQAPYVLVGICIALLAAVPAFADPSVASKKAEAQQVMGQLRSLSDSLERARSQYDAANARLAKIQRDLRENRHELHVAQDNLRTSQRTIAQRLVTLYTNSDADSTLEVILGARNLDDLITRMDSAKAVTKSDAHIFAQVKRFREAVAHNGALLKHAHAQQAQVVAQRAAAKHEVESKIATEQHLYNSLKGEIARLVAADQARQLQMAQAAASRLKQQQITAAQASAETVVGISAITPQSDTAVAPPPTHGGVVGVAMSQLGVPYVWGGASPGGFDCSGLVMWAYAQVGVSLPHSSYAQYNAGVPVSRDQLAPGDLVFFDGLGHVGMYIGGGQFIHAPHTGDVVKISSLDESWYSAAYVGARRIL
jgi:cell wall-associated NlpC family hydrolase/type II secretory pathway pseudopilin PulG